MYVCTYVCMYNCVGDGLGVCCVLCCYCVHAHNCVRHDAHACLI